MKTDNLSQQNMTKAKPLLQPVNSGQSKFDLLQSDAYFLVDQPPVLPQRRISQQTIRDRVDISLEPSGSREGMPLLILESRQSWGYYLDKVQHEERVQAQPQAVEPAPVDNSGDSNSHHPQRKPSKFKNANKYFIARLKKLYLDNRQKFTPETASELEKRFNLHSVGFKKLNEILEVKQFRLFIRSPQIIKALDHEHSAVTQKQDEEWKNKRLWYPVMKEVILGDKPFNSWSELQANIRG